MTRLGGRDLLLLLPDAEALLLLLRFRNLVKVREKGLEDGAGSPYVTACGRGIGGADVTGCEGAAATADEAGTAVGSTGIGAGDDAISDVPIGVVALRGVRDRAKGVTALEMIGVPR